MSRWVAVRSRKCPFGILLKRHCPLPPVTHSSAAPSPASCEPIVSKPDGAPDGPLASGPAGPAHQEADAWPIPAVRSESGSEALVQQPASGLSDHPSAQPISTDDARDEIRDVVLSQPASAAAELATAAEGRRSLSSSSGQRTSLVGPRTGTAYSTRSDHVHGLLQIALTQATQGQSAARAQPASPEQHSLGAEQALPLTQVPYSPSKLRDTKWRPQQPSMTTAACIAISTPLSTASRPSQEIWREKGSPLTQCSPPTSLAGCVPMLCELDSQPNISGSCSSGSHHGLPRADGAENSIEQPAPKRVRLRQSSLREIQGAPATQSRIGAEMGIGFDATGRGRDKRGQLPQPRTAEPESSEHISMEACPPPLGEFSSEVVEPDTAAARPAAATGPSEGASDCPEGAATAAANGVTEGITVRAEGAAAGAAEQPIQGEQQAPLAASESWVPHAQVTAFAWAAVRRIVPQASPSRVLDPSELCPYR